MIFNRKYHYFIGDKSLTFMNIETGNSTITDKENLFGLGFSYNFILNHKLDILNQIKNLDEKLLMDRSLDRKINLLIVDTTNKCNLQCKYCSVDAKLDGLFNSEENIIKGFFKLLDSKNINDQVTIEFSGGEPLLNFTLIKKIVPKLIEIAGIHDIKINFSIQTNGICLNDEVVEFLYFYKFSVGVSIDGNKVWNVNRLDYYGKESFDIVVKNILNAREKNLPISLLGVIYKPEQYLDYIDFAHELEVRNFRLNNLTNIGRSKCNMNQGLSFSKNINEYANSYIEMANNLIANKKYEGYHEANLNYFLWGLLNWQPHMCFRSPCGAGRNQIHIDVYGNIYACQDWRSIKDSCIMNVDDDEKLDSAILKSKRVKELSVPNHERYPVLCCDCSWKVRCGVCPRELFTDLKDYDGPIASCKFNNLVYEKLFDIIYINKDKVFKYLGM